MYPGSTSPKKTLVGLPVRNIDYGTLHKSLRMTDRDVKRNLQPEFLESLGKMCLSSTGRAEVGLKPEGNRDSAISHLDNGSRDVKERKSSPLLNVSITSPNALNNSSLSHANCSPSNYCGICRKRKEEMTHYGIYHQDDSVDMVMGGVIDRIDHLIDRLGKGGYDKKEFGLGNKENRKNENVGIMLPCETCAVRAKKRYAHAECQTEEPAVDEQDLEIEDVEGPDVTPIDEAKIQITESTPPNKQAEADLPADNDTDKSKLSPPKAKRLKKSSSSSNVKMSNEGMQQSDHNFKTKKLPRSTSFSSSRTILLRGVNRAPLIKSQAVDRDEETNRELPVKLLAVDPEVPLEQRDKTEIQIKKTEHFPERTKTESFSEPRTTVETPPEPKTLLAYTILSPIQPTPVSSGVISPRVSVGGDPLLVSLSSQTHAEVGKQDDSCREDDHQETCDEVENSLLNEAVAVKPSIGPDETSTPVPTSDEPRNYEFVLSPNSDAPSMSRRDSRQINEDCKTKIALKLAMSSSIPVKLHTRADSVKQDILTEECVEYKVRSGSEASTDTLGEEPGNGGMRRDTFSSLERVYTDVDDDNMSVLSSDDEEFRDDQLETADEDQVPVEVREYEIAASLRREMPEVGSTETIHFKMLPYKNLYVMGQRKFVGSLPKRIALKSNYELNYHITVFKTLSSDRPDIRMKRLKELVTHKSKTSPVRRGGMGRTVDSSKLGNLLVVDIPRYSREAKRKVGGDIRIPVINMRDGHTNKLWLSERVSAILMSRSPRLRFAIEMAKSNRVHWKLAAKDLTSNQRPYKYSCLYSGKSYTQFYLNEMRRFVTKPLLSKCLVYYVDIYEDNTKDHVKSKTFISCLGNITAKDSKATPLMNFEDRIKEHVRAGQKLHDPKVNIFNVALQNPILSLDEPGRFLPQKGSQEITKCPNVLFVPLDFGFSSWSKPTTQDHLSALKQAYCDVFCSNGPAGYNV